MISSISIHLVKTYFCIIFSQKPITLKPTVFFRNYFTLFLAEIVNDLVQKGEIHTREIKVVLRKNVVLSISIKIFKNFVNILLSS